MWAPGACFAEEIGVHLTYLLRRRVKEENTRRLFYMVLGAPISIPQDNSVADLTETV